MRRLWIALAPLAVLVGVGVPAWGKAVTKPFTCEIDLNKLRDVDIERNVPASLREDENGDPLEALPVYLTSGEKKCTPSTNPVSQIRCETDVENWPNPRNVTIKTLREGAFCEWFINQSDCRREGKAVATNLTFKIKRKNSNTASLELFCTSNRPLQPIDQNGG
jgi:hypothetical protein